MGNCNSAPRGGGIAISADVQRIKDMRSDIALQEFCDEYKISMADFDPADLALYFIRCKREADRQAKALAELEALEHT